MPIEFRPVRPRNPLKPERGEPRQDLWFRFDGSLPDDALLHRCLIAYASDFNLIGTALSPHGRSCPIGHGSRSSPTGSPGCASSRPTGRSRSCSRFSA